MLLTRIVKSVTEAWRMPRVAIDLMHHATADNDPFYDRVVRQFYRDCRRRHRRFPLVRAMQVGVGLCPLPETHDEYLRGIEASARRNCKKALREGCTFRRINFNDHLEEVKQIQQSAEVRQGAKMPDAYLRGDVRPCLDPPSRTRLHDYSYFGVFHEGRLRAYASCLVSGELCSLEHILGHAQSLEVGVVPLLIAEIARYHLENHPRVKYYAYGTFFGATENMQRFKRKFAFLPHYVTWELGDKPVVAQATAAGGAPCPLSR
ncbi:MAG: hypothetical protein K2R98_03500 [Gemmataceae bacterium]|nr:hypothetical protein [Gemmataceae bacterium]